MMPTIPLPPLRLREMVGRTDEAAFNPVGCWAFEDLPAELDLQHIYSRVFDFGCGCGRQARQLMLQATPPREYVGVDASEELISWAAQNLTPANRSFSFFQHPGGNTTVPLDFPKRHFTLVNAHSIFTHLLPYQAAFYLRELESLVRDDGLIRTTWFFFNRDALIPANVHYGQPAFYVNHEEPRQAVYFDWTWFCSQISALELFAARIVWPSTVKGHQSCVVLTRRRDVGRNIVEFRPPASVIGF